MNSPQTSTTQAILTAALAVVSLAIIVLVLWGTPHQETTSQARSVETPEDEIATPATATSTEEAPEEASTEEPQQGGEENDEAETVVVETATPEEETSSTTQATLTVKDLETIYQTPPLSFDTINTATLPAIVNILCGSTSSSAVRGATGTGVVIDPRGVILTNAHVAQYLLVSEHPDVHIQCVIRTGTPATERYTAELLAFPRSWAETHGADIKKVETRGTGEHDWALLYINGTTNGAEKPATFPFVSYDTQEGVAISGDSVLLAAYPAAFLGGATLRSNLWPSSSVITLQKVFTFDGSFIDLLSLGGSVVAQGGASGGAVVNQWNKLVGLIVTSSIAENTADRDLRAITLAHINRSVQQHTGLTLENFLAEGNFSARASAFTQQHAASLRSLFAI